MKPQRFTIPPELAHLKVDERGYPIPFFVPIIDRKPAFKLLDQRKQHQCINDRLCPICGRKLYKDYNYVITGPVGYMNQIVTDPPMHRVCAEFTLSACPHLYFERTQRIMDPRNNPAVMHEKPSEIRLIRINKHHGIKADGIWYVKFSPVSYQAYMYEDGVLQLWTQET